MSKILVVDDEESLLILVKTILEGAGYDVTTAGSGPQALERLDSEEVDLVLLDVMMPDMDGWEVVKEIRNNPETSHLPIAMLTVKTLSPEYFYSNDVEGLVDYINKPFSKKDLLRRVEDILEEARNISAKKIEHHDVPEQFFKEYEELSKAERLYENLGRSLEYSLEKMDPDSKDYHLIKDALEYGRLLLEKIKEKKAGYEGLLKKD